jgi:hypothetical protein
MWVSMEEKRRAKTFLIVAAILTGIVYFSFKIMNINTAWYVNPIVATILALFYTFFPVTSSFGLSLIFVIPLGIVLAIGGVVFWVTSSLIMVFMFLFELALAIAIFTIPGVVLVYGGYIVIKELGATAGSILFIAAIIAYGRLVSEKIEVIITDTWSSGWKFIKKIAKILVNTNWFAMTLFPIKLPDKISEIAINFGESLGGDIIEFYDYREWKW